MATYEVRGCRREAGEESPELFRTTSFPLLLASDNDAAEWFGVYENLPDGTHQCVLDVPTLERAHSIANWLNAAPSGVRIPLLELRGEE